MGWWDFVRYDVIHTICIEKGLYGNHKDFKKNFFLTLPSIIIQIRNLSFSIKNFLNVDLEKWNADAEAKININNFISGGIFLPVHLYFS